MSNGRAAEGFGRLSRVTLIFALLWSVPLASSGSELTSSPIEPALPADESAGSKAASVESLVAEASEAHAEALAGTSQRGDDRWAMIQAQLIPARQVDSDERVVRLDVPGRAFDGARVPITIRAARDADVAVERLHIVVDNNPVPVAASFSFEPGVAWNSIDTELRINEYSSVRVIAELADGSIDMSTRFVKAVGGCSAPPSSYEQSDTTQLGNFRGGLDEILNPKLPVTARIRLVHPNASGMQFDQFTRTYIPPHFVHTMGAAFDGKPLFTLATNFSLSQDPVLGFDFRAPVDGVLSLYAVDSENKRFEQSWPVSVASIDQSQ